MPRLFSSSQLRAARGLLNWSRPDLAARTGVSEQTIHRFENDMGEPEINTQKKIHRVLEEMGIELLGDIGVTRKSDEIITLTGSNAYVHLLDNVFHSLKGVPASEALFFFVDNSKSPPDVVASHHRIREAGIKCRYLCSEEPNRLDFPVSDYRGVPKKFFYNSVMVVYADKVATVIADLESFERVVIVRNVHAASAQRSLFNLIWSICSTPKAIGK